MRSERAGAKANPLELQSLEIENQESKLGGSNAKDVYIENHSPTVAMIMRLPMIFIDFDHCTAHFEL
ncbi:predicted protein [Sclerotinia sclerotiorum 1980 UF-70]|uniref:Uncharacterized protein n=1 Tax=Sclerotinia sclerotiorum (strain ATCC 18683 / 1980 / Ss-1) TaxID=665079 RepID=A7F791_SCLS1|nr:predicted protein [Sclerotinia sclerotiorum 1980 UF-70]EDN98612.1 predicted protein [Sclerotinia sclerotiorum 1980 UF-70]